MLALRSTATSRPCGRSILSGAGLPKDQVQGSQGSSNWVVSHQKNRSSILDQFVSSRWHFSVMALLYGGWHLLAWNGPFPSYLQQTLWRLSGIGVGTIVFWISITFTLRVLSMALDVDLCADWCKMPPSGSNSKRNWVYRNISDLGSWFIYNFLFFLTPPLSWALSLWLIFARCYLVVGSVLALPYSPDSAFQTPNWSLYFPHAS